MNKLILILRVTFFNCHRLATQYLTASSDITHSKKKQLKYKREIKVRIARQKLIAVDSLVNSKKWTIEAHTLNDLH